MISCRPPLQKRACFVIGNPSWPADVSNIMEPTHSKTIGYVLWIFGFTGSHRFYFGKPISGAIWFCTLGLLGIGWLIDLFLIPRMERQAEIRYRGGDVDYSVAWILQTFCGALGIHRIYMGKWVTGLIYMFTGGLAFIGVLYDYCTLNGQISGINAKQRSQSGGQIGPERLIEG